MGQGAYFKSRGYLVYVHDARSQSMMGYNAEKTYANELLEDLATIKALRRKALEDL
jgi:hypothetical protein